VRRPSGGDVKSTVPAIRLLVIDDSATVRAMVEQIVAGEPNGQVVGVASSVDAARPLLLDVKPNLITLDLNMPGVSGLSFLDELAEQQHAPVIVLSSSTVDGSSASKEALAKGADACFDKSRLSADAAEFRRLLRSVVAKRERELIAGVTD
jgi:chemotaxis response regulator CheB